MSRIVPTPNGAWLVIETRGCAEGCGLEFVKTGSSQCFAPDCPHRKLTPKKRQRLLARQPLDTRSLR